MRRHLVCIFVIAIIFCTYGYDYFNELINKMKLANRETSNRSLKPLLCYKELFANITKTNYYSKRISSFNATSFYANTNGSKIDLNIWMKKMENKYFETKRRIQENCKKFNITVSKTTKSIDIVFDDYHKWAYCPNAKAGTTTMVKILTRLMISDKRPGDQNGLTNYLQNKCWKNRKNRYIVRDFYKLPSNFNEVGNDSQNIKNFALSKYLKDHQILSFTFVRHPFERLVSAYKDKVVHKHILAEPFKHRYDKWYKKDHTFPSFVNLVLKEYNRSKMDRHWKPFYRRCRFCEVPYEVIGKMETFNEDIKYIIIKSKLESVLPPEEIYQIIENSEPPMAKTEREKESLNYFSQLKRTVIQKLYKIYRMDFKMFDYDANKYLNLI